MQLCIDPEVARALQVEAPVVALESTLICHGLPRPRNLDLALAVESAVREAGAEPATIALIDGKLRVGLDAAPLERLARAEGVAKCSPRDLALVLAGGGLGATTVAGTLLLSAAVRYFRLGPAGAAAVPLIASKFGGGR